MKGPQEALFSQSPPLGSSNRNQERRQTAYDKAARNRATLESGDSWSI